MFDRIVMLVFVCLFVSFVHRECFMLLRKEICEERKRVFLAEKKSSVFERTFCSSKQNYVFAVSPHVNLYVLFERREK